MAGSAKRRFCSRECVNQVAAAEAIVRNCENCGDQFRPNKRSSKQVREGKVQRFCSVECRGENQRLQSARLDIVLILRRITACVGCGKAILPSHSNRPWCSPSCRPKRKSRWVPKVHELVCKGCDKPFQQSIGHQLFCTKACAKRADKRSSGNHRKRARRAGVVYEAVNRIKVFERDNWRCQVCGCKTPRKKSGSNDDTAPELDHRIPLALRGGHTWDNLQTACRKCNQRKGGHLAIGQMNLFPQQHCARTHPPGHPST